MAGKMKRLSTLLAPKPSKKSPQSDDPESPEQVAMKGVRLFCESGTPSNSMQRGEEVTILPSIVEAAESSPQAASSAAYQLRKFLGRDQYSHPYKQYNAIMLIRILADNPGRGFTRYIDEKFKDTIQKLLKESRDPSVQQMIRETLSAFEREKQDDENLKPLLKMWEKERKTMPQMQYAGPTPSFQGRSLYQTNWQQQQDRQQFHTDGRAKHALPNPEELSGRVEEARTSAKLLIQLVQTTPPEDVQDNELIKEFAERCQSAQRSLNGYMKCTDPAPDEPTFQTLIETTEQLGMASSKHQRALLAARRQNSQNNVLLNKAERLYDENNATGNTEPHATNQASRSPQPTQQSITGAPPVQQNGLFGRQSMNPTSPKAGIQPQPDPFSDVNQITTSSAPPAQYNYPAPASSEQSSARYYGGYASPAQPARATQQFGASPSAAGRSELSGVTTPTAKNESFASRDADLLNVAPPPGPPPGRAPIPNVQIPSSADDRNDLYDTSPVATRNGPPSAVSSMDQRPRSAGLYSIDSEARRPSHDAPSAQDHVSQNNPQHMPLSTEALRSHDDSQPTHQDRTGQSETTPARKQAPAAWGEAETPTVDNRQQGGTLGPSRVKDDEPMTPALGVSGAGWQY